MNLDTVFRQRISSTGFFNHISGILIQRRSIQLIIILVRMEVLPEKRKELSQTLQSIVEQVRKESGCLHAGFFRDGENQEDSDNHLRSDIFTVLLGAGALMRRPPEIVVQTVDRSAEFKA